MDVILNGLTLAYIGDAYYELSVRTYLVQNKLTNVNDLHKKAIQFTSGAAQAAIVIQMMEKNMITEEEIETFKRGRNSSGPGRKNIDAKTYHYATGFEALIGDLYLKNKDRADELIKLAILYIEKGDFNGKDS
ncbi:MAG: Mini-ribonuclease 3 [Tenericutes bacterium HGW-Tenericutes-2]|nr:MAG: Mini-ribonuclease 3 [Tenericutes bacterium HGW-Tenericutes-2]